MSAKLFLNTLACQAEAPQITFSLARADNRPYRITSYLFPAVNSPLLGLLKSIMLAFTGLRFAIRMPRAEMTSAESVWDSFLYVPDVVCRLPVDI